MQSAIAGLPDLDALSLDELRLRKSHKWRSHPPDVIPLFVAEMDFPVWEGVRRVVAEAAERSDLGYPPPEAGLDFGRAVANWLRANWQMEVNPAWVLALPDVLRGLDTSVVAFSDTAEGVIVTPPVYPPFLESAANHGRRRSEVPVIRDAEGGWHLDLAGVTAALQNGARLVLLCHPHNPAGAPFPADELRELVEVVRRHDAVIVSDEIHAPLTFPGRRHHPLVQLHPGAGEVTVTLVSFTKAWNFAGLKCGIAVFHSERTWSKFMNLPRRTRAGVGILGMLASLEVMASGRPWLDHIMAYLDDTRRWLVGAIEEYLPGVGYHPPEASYIAWLDFSRTRIAADPAGILLTDARVALKSGSDFGRGGEGFARCCFATSRQILEQALRAMSPVARGKA